MSNKIKDGGSAFPFQEESAEGTKFSANHGMSLRDYFAIESLNGLLSSVRLNTHWDHTERANFAYKQADAMLKEREK